ncbi:MAG: response regulator [Acidobacteriota bacterium]
MASSSRVLIVEDDPNTLSGYLEFLASAGFDPTGVQDGLEALTSALRDPPAAIVTDIMLPGMNGFDLAAALRQDQRTRAIPIIGLTAHWDTDIPARAREVAMQVVLSKPCVPAHLVAELERMLGLATALAAVRAVGPIRMTISRADRHEAPAHVRQASGSR